MGRNRGGIELWKRKGEVEKWRKIEKKINLDK
jgi:hypothetical protein